MSEITSIQNSALTPLNKPSVNFKAERYASMDNEYDTFIKEQKKAKRKQNILTYLNAGAMAAIIISVIGFPFMEKYASKFLGKSNKELRKMMERDLSNAKEFKNLHYNEEITKFVNEWKASVENPQKLKDKACTPINTALLYGPPGTGKTTLVESITKMFPNAKLFDMNVTQMGSEYQSVGERNFKAAIDIICNEADKNPKKKFVVLMDEIDSMIQVDNSINSKHSDKMLNEFKKAFTEKLMTRPNIFTFGATNLEVNTEKAMTAGGKLLDSAMLDRFGEKVYIGLPNAKQLAQTFADRASKGKKVVDTLKNPDSPEMIKIAEFLEKHGASFRKLHRTFDAAGRNPEDTLTVKHFADAIKTKQAELNFTNTEYAQLLKDLKITT